MKKIIFSIIAILLVAVSCTGVKTMSSGQENESFLQFVGKPGDYKDGVSVNVDDKNTFTAEVVKDHADRPKGKVYAISTGTHIVTVSYKNKVLYKQQIFLSSQETKKIELP